MADADGGCTRGRTADSDGDGVGNNADTDDDGDGVDDNADAFPLDPLRTTDSDNILYTVSESHEYVWRWNGSEEVTEYAIQYNYLYFLSRKTNNTVKLAAWEIQKSR